MNLTISYWNTTASVRIHQRFCMHVSVTHALFLHPSGMPPSMI